MLRDTNRIDEALASYEQALRLHPDNAVAHNNKGIALARQGKLSEAVAAFRQTLRLQPNYVKAYSNLGTALLKLGRLEEAAANCRQALRLLPTHADAHNNLAVVLGEQGKFDEALASYAKALRCKPDFADVHRNRAMIWLLQGRFKRGWAEYEWRWQCKDSLLSSLPKPPWDGASLSGRRILLLAEQGFGDTMQFIRYARLLNQRGGKVIMVCQEPVLPLLVGCSGVDQLLAQDTPLPDFDVYAPLMSLPRILKHGPGHPSPRTCPTCSPTRNGPRRRRELSPVGAFKIGIAWQGRPTYQGDHLRSIPLGRFGCLAALPGVQLFSLQKGQRGAGRPRPCSLSPTWPAGS